MQNRRSRVKSGLKAFFVHFSGSFLISTIVAAVVFFLWFPYPFRDLAGGVKLFLILMIVDVICGPLLTAIIYNKEKSRKELFLDISIICILQLGALAYGLYSIASARPVILAFETDRFVVQPAMAFDEENLKNAQPEFQNLSWNGPILVGTREALSGIEVLESIDLSSRGIEPSMRPSWWRSYELSRNAVKSRMLPISNLENLANDREKKIIRNAIENIGMVASAVYYLPLVSAKNLDEWIVLLDGSAKILGYAPVGGFK